MSPQGDGVPRYSEPRRGGSSRRFTRSFGFCFMRSSHLGHVLPCISGGLGTPKGRPRGASRFCFILFSSSAPLCKHFRKPGSVLCDHLSRMQVTLHLQLPLYPGREAKGSRHGIAPNKVYTAEGVTILPVSSYLAFSPLPCGGCFLLHCLGSHLRRTLSVILSRGSPDFPQESPFV